MRNPGTTWIAIGLIAATASVAQARDPFGGWQPGDIVVQDALRPETEALGAATKSRYTHVALVRVTGGGPIALDTHPTLWEVELDEFINKGRGGSIAVYRVRGIDETDGYKAMHLANQILHTPYDPSFQPGQAALYGGEMVRLAFEALDLTLGREELIGDLPTDALATYLLDQRQEDLACTSGGLDRDGCRADIDRRRIISPASIVDDPRLDCVFSNFPDAPASCADRRPPPAALP